MEEETILFTHQEIFLGANVRNMLLIKWKRVMEAQLVSIIKLGVGQRWRPAVFFNSTVPRIDDDADK